ncbi:MAG: hypothetical protein Q7T53_13215 [Deltaproteobacteria bacterium]|nr:hypothetical protein [Deltaproteobacteria bacterium]
MSDKVYLNLIPDIKETEVKMKKLLLAALFLVFPIMSSIAPAEEWDRDAAQNWTTVKKAGEVTFTATFVNPTDIWDPGFLVFYVQVDSDTLNLDSLDFKKDIVLRDDNDWTFLPKEVKERGSGHHREAVLKFLRSRFKVSYIELVVRKTSLADETVFRWFSMRSM